MDDYRPPRPAATPPPPQAIRPHQLWSQLTPEQQHHLHQALILIGRELVAAMLLPTGKEASHD